jgi:hypothetical protein
MLPLLVFVAAILSPSAEAVVQPAAPSGGVVYFYFIGYSLPGGMMIGTPRISIYCDGRRIAKVKKGTFVGFRLSAGRHTCASKGLRTSLAETEITLDVQPDSTRFIRLEPSVGNVKWWAHLRVVSQDEGYATVSKLEPLQADAIDDRARAITARPTPARVVLKSSEPPLTNTDVLALKRAGLDDDVVLLKVQYSPGAYDVSSTGVEQLRREGVSNELITAMTEAVVRTRADRKD